MISEVFWDSEKRWAFQFVDGMFNLYDDGGDFVADFTNFDDLLRYVYSVKNVGFKENGDANK